MSEIQTVPCDWVEAIERATLDAVTPEATAELPDWLLAFDPGSVRRAHSAAPLRHDGVTSSLLNEIEKRYRQAGLAPCFRLADVPGLDEVRAALTARGYRGEQPTLVMTSDVELMRGVSERADAVLRDQPDQRWARVVSGEGFDPVDAAHRVRALSRAKDALYASIGEGEDAAAVGVLAFSEAWGSVHGMRTLASRRGEGLAARILASMAIAAQEHGVKRVFLQVDQTNEGAQRLYRRAGFKPAWVYRYWLLPR